MLIKTTHINYILNIWKIIFAEIVCWILNILSNNRTRLMFSNCNERSVAAITSSVLHQMGSRAPPLARYELNSSKPFAAMRFF